MKKKKCGCRCLKIFLCLTGIGAGIYFLFKDLLMDRFFNSKYEDKILKGLEIGRLALDLLMWPIDYVRALLP